MKQKIPSLSGKHICCIASSIILWLFLVFYQLNILFLISSVPTWTVDFHQHFSAHHHLPSCFHFFSRNLVVDHCPATSSTNGSYKKIGLSSWRVFIKCISMFHIYDDALEMNVWKCRSIINQFYWISCLSILLCVCIFVCIKSVPQIISK